MKFNFMKRGLVWVLCGTLLFNTVGGSTVAGTAALAAPISAETPTSEESASDEIASDKTGSDTTDSGSTNPDTNNNTEDNSNGGAVTEESQSIDASTKDTSTGDALTGMNGTGETTDSDTETTETENDTEAPGDEAGDEEVVLTLDEKKEALIGMLESYLAGIGEDSEDAEYDYNAEDINDIIDWIKNSADESTINSLYETYKDKNSDTFTTDDYNIIFAMVSEAIHKSDENEIMMLDEDTEANKIGLIGDIVWSGDSAWSDLRPTAESLNSSLHLYKMVNGSKEEITSLPEGASFTWTASAGNKYTYKYTNLPEAEYVITLDTCEGYETGYGGATYAPMGEATIDDYEMGPITNTLLTEEEKLSGLYYGNGPANIVYTVNVNKGGSTIVYKAAYKDGTEIKTALDGKVISSLSSGVKKDVTLTIPKGATVQVTGAACDKSFSVVKQEGAPYTFIGKTSESVTKIWKDTMGDTRPAVSFKVTASVGGEAIEVTDYSALGLDVTGEDNAPKLSNSSGASHLATETYTIGNLPSYWKDGDAWKQANYSFEENSVEGYKSEWDSDHKTLTNSKITDMTATIKWQDNGNVDNDNKRPTAEIEKNNIKLYRYTGGNSGSKELVPEDSYKIEWNTEGDSWTVTYTDLDAYDSKSSPYTYVVEQGTVEGYLSKCDNSGNSDHSQSTALCYDKGSIINTRNDVTSASFTYEWKGTETGRPDGAVYLWRYIGNEPSKAAAVTDSNKEVVYQSINKNISSGTKTTVTFDNLPKYDDNGNEYTYIAKTILEGDSDFIYVYPTGQDYAAMDENIILMPQKMRDEEFSMRWNTNAYPEIPSGCKAVVKLQKKNKGDSTAEWVDASDLYTDEIAFSGFTRDLLEQEIVLRLPQYDTSTGNEGNELEYRLVLDHVEKGGTAAVGSDNTFTLGGQEYKTETNEHEIVNTLYGQITYHVTKTWNPSQTANKEGAYADVQLKNGTSVERNATLNSANSWQQDLGPVNRFDSNGFEIDYTIVENDFSPNKDDDNKDYHTIITYSRPDNASVMNVTVHNYIPGEGNYITVNKVWIDGGDYESRVPVKLEIDCNGLREKDQILSVENNWTQIVSVAHKNDEANKYSIKEVNAGSGDTFQVNGDILITDSHRYAVTYNGFTVTNKVVGAVDPTITVKWKDGDVDTDRPDVTATLKKLDNGFWVPVDGVTPAQLTATTATVETDGDGNPIWTYTFSRQPKYDDSGKIIQYRIDTEFTSDAYIQTDKNSSYEPHETNKTATEVDDYTDKLNNSIELTKTGKKNVTVYKLWKDGGSSNRPDIQIQTVNRSVTGGASVDYTETETDYGYVEQKWVKRNTTIGGKSVDYYEITITNLERFDENGNEWKYTFEEVFTGDRAGYATSCFEADSDALGNISAVTKANSNTDASGGTVGENGCFLNRREATIVLSGKKVWSNLEAGMTEADLPSPKLYLRRRIGDEKDIDGTYKGADTSFNSGNSIFAELNTNKYSFVFDKDELGKSLPRYNEEGEEYTYYVEEDFSTLKINPYESYMTTVNDFALENVYKTSAEDNTRKIDVIKNWNTAFDVASAQYPDITFQLWRYDSAEGTDSAKMIAEKTVSVVNNSVSTSNSNATGSCTFDNLRIVSPKGNIYNYKVVEKVKNGYVESASGDTKTVSTDNSYVIVNDVTYDPDTKKFSDTEKTVSFTNRYVGSDNAENPAITLKGMKQWNENSGDTSLRPTVSDFQGRLKVYRYTGDGSVSEDITNKCVFTWKDGAEETSSASLVSGTNNPTADKWYYTITATTGDYQTFLTYAPNGQKYQYKIVEGTINNYKCNKSTVTQKSVAGSTITLNDLVNYLDGTLAVKKVWEDNNNRYGLRPSKVTVKLQRKLKDEADTAFVDVTESDGTTAVTKDITSSNWEVKFENLPSCNSAGKEYVYKAVETHIWDSDGNNYSPENAYKIGYAFAENGTETITNTVKSTKLTVNKTWDDDSNKYGTRPLNGDGKWYVNLQLQYVIANADTDINSTSLSWKKFGKQETIVGTDATGNTGSVTFENLPTVNLAGNNYFFRAVETSLKNYDTEHTYSSSADGFKTEVKNKLKKETDSTVKVKKIWRKEDGITLPEKISVELLWSTDKTNWKSFTPKKTAELKPDTDEAKSWKQEWTNVPSVDQYGAKLYYWVKETSTTNGFEVSYPDKPAGTNASLEQNIINTQLIDYKVTLYWVNNDHGLTETATMLLQRKAEGDDSFENVNDPSATDSSAVLSKELTGDKTYIWTNLPLYDAAGNRYTYRVIESKIGTGTDTKNGQYSITGISDNANYQTVNESYEQNYKPYTIEVTAFMNDLGASSNGNKLYGNEVTNTPALITLTGEKTWDFSGLNDYLKGNSTYLDSLLPVDKAFFESVLLLKWVKRDDVGYESFNASLPTVDGEDILPTFTKGTWSGGECTWSYTYTDLPKYYVKGDQIQYKVEEDKDNPYSTTWFTVTNSEASLNLDNGTLNNYTNAIKTTEITVKKKWLDNNNENGLRPSATDFAQKLVIYETGKQTDGQPYDTNKFVKLIPQPTVTIVSATAGAEEWKYKFEKLPMYVRDTTATGGGADYAYRKAEYVVMEEDVVNYQNIITKDTGATDATTGQKYAYEKNNYTLTNKPLVIVLHNTTKVVSGASTSLKGATFTITGGELPAIGVKVTISGDDGKLALTPTNMGGNALKPGVDYTITQNTAQAGYQIMNHKDGDVVKPGSIVFYIDEATGELKIKENGNTPIDANDSDPAGITHNGTNIPVLQIQNISTNASVTLTKTNSSDGSKIGGIKFVLYRQKGTDKNETEDELINSDGQVVAKTDTPATSFGTGIDTKSYPNTAILKTSGEEDTKGTITVSNLTEGKYYFKEVDATTEYKLPSGGAEYTAFDVTGDEHNKTIELSVKNRPVSSLLRIFKLDKVDQTPVKGVKYEVKYTPDGSGAETIYTLTTNNKGQAILDASVTDPNLRGDKGELKLNKGKYTVTESYAPTGYKNTIKVGGADQKFTCSFEITDETEGTYVFIGAHWLAQTEDGQNNRNKIGFTISPEMEAEFLSHDLDDRTENAGLVNRGGAVYNDRIPGSVTLTKVDGDNTSTKLDNVKFKLEKKDTSGNFVDKFINLLTGKTYKTVATGLGFEEDGTGTPGVIKITGLEWGTYRLSEVETKPGYFFTSTDYCREFTIQGGENDDGSARKIDWVFSAVSGTDGVAIKNYQTNIHIGVEPSYGAYSGTGSTNYAKSEADVKLKLTGKFVNDDGTVSENTKTWTSGTSTQTFTGQLVVGETYTLEEVDTPEESETWTQPVKFKINEAGEIEIVDGGNETLSDGQLNGQVTKGDKVTTSLGTQSNTTLFVRNVEINGAVELKKTGFQGKELAGVKFKLYKVNNLPSDEEITNNEDGTPLSIVTDENGIWRSHDGTKYIVKLKPGKYYFVEDSTPAGYKSKTADDKFEFEITADYHFKTVDSEGNTVINYVPCEVTNSLLFDLVDENTSGTELRGYKFKLKGTLKKRDPNTGAIIEGAEEELEIEFTYDDLEDISKLLIPGKNYELTQVAIDAGYILNGKLEFSLDETTGEILLTPNSQYRVDPDTGALIVINARKPADKSGDSGVGGPYDSDGSSSSTQDPSASVKVDDAQLPNKNEGDIIGDGHVPGTGDNSSPFAWLLAGLGAGIAAMILGIRSRKQRKDEDQDSNEQ